MRIAGIRAQLPRIQAALKQAEERIRPKEFEEQAQRLGIFPIRGGSSPYYLREPHYGGTNIEGLLRHLEILKLPSHHHFVDLGSGLGHACIAAATHFDRVTGLEKSGLILAEAQKIRDEFGLTNIEYRNEDFMGASLLAFDVIYFYKPFSAHVFALLRDKLLEAKKGTAIISHRYMESELRDQFNFHFLDRLDPNTPPKEFYTFIRK